MNVDIKDVKSWYNRHDVKVGDEGYFFNIIQKTLDRSFKRGIITEINNDRADCFVGAYDYPVWDYNFFLPLDAVKEDKPEKKYRPFESMAEFTKVVYNLVPNYLNITGVGESFTVRRKYNQHIEKVLITHLEYDENRNLISINGQSLKSLFENYEIITDEGKIIPFGVEVKND